MYPIGFINKTKKLNPSLANLQGNIQTVILKLADCFSRRYDGLLPGKTHSNSFIDKSIELPQFSSIENSEIINSSID